MFLCFHSEVLASDIYLKNFNIILTHFPNIWHIGKIHAISGVWEWHCFCIMKPINLMFATEIMCVC